VYRYDTHTCVLRQSKALSAEAPFLYLLFGNERAMLLDTGASKKTIGDPLRETVDGIIEAWLADNPRKGYQLIVAHTHGHLDHVAGDSHFADRPGTTIVDRDVFAVRTFFGFTSWPEQIVSFDLGARVLDVTGTPGHHPSTLTDL
jgi:glyoxylase-like metal-dependent hydrolase (beta-lactamase superfamily II)